MKKVYLLLIVASFGLAFLSSCKTADCPAYSKVETTEVELIA